MRVRAASGVCLALLAFATASCGGTPSPAGGEVADLMIVNGRVFTADEQGTMAQAVAVAGNKILRVGTDQELAALLNDKPLPAYTPHSITDPARYRKELARVRRRGYAVDDEEYLPGVRAISAPILAGRGQTIATITVVGVSARLGPEKTREAAAEVLAAAESISRRLGAEAYPRASGAPRVAASQAAAASRGAGRTAGALVGG